jgi:surface antigen
MWRMSFASIAVVMAAATGAAAAPCYLPAEAEADQAMRLRADLKVIGEVCKDPSYGRFLDRNRDTLAAYEEILTERFARDSTKSADTSLRVYLTRLENDARLRAAESASYCPDAFDLVATTSFMRPDELRSYAALRAEASRQDYASCTQPAIKPGPAPNSPTVTAALTPPVSLLPAPSPQPAIQAALTEAARGDSDEDGLVGGLAGSDLARMLDPADRQKIKEITQQTLETSVSGQVMGWHNPFSRNAGTIVAARAFPNAAGEWCRGIEQSITVVRETRHGKGTACRRPDGRWEIQP